ncbi:MAG TPA: class A beta-lactamase [Rhizomicrobium sp.]|nr:class A beta-lactamase [Rhizomicrobium sp.]
MACIPAAQAWALASWDRFGDLEKSTGARIGVAAIDTGDGRTLCWRESERFLMCSSFKLSLAAAVLARADAGQERLDRVIRYQKADLLDVSPATAANLTAGMRVDALCQAAVIYSDNTAANLLLASLGGPAGVTSFWRSLGDETSHLDRAEPMLNLPDGEKDTTTPVAMLGNLKTMLLGDVLKPESRRRLTDWMAASTTGNLMLRAGLPQSWAIGDKTGRYANDAHNAAIDLAIITPQGRKPLLIAAFTMNGRGDDAAHQAVLADIGKITAATFA